MCPTIEDIYLATVETDRGSREHLRIYDSSGIDPALSPMLPTGDQCHMMRACNDLARRYTNIVDGFILVYDTSRPDSLDCLITMKKEIDKVREKKEGLFLILGHQISRKTNHEPSILRETPSSRAVQWANKEKLQHYEVNALDRKTLLEPLIYIASRLSSTSNRSSFVQLSIVRKTIRGD